MVRVKKKKTSKNPDRRRINSLNIHIYISVCVTGRKRCVTASQRLQLKANGEDSLGNAQWWLLRKQLNRGRHNYILFIFYWLLYSKRYRKQYFRAKWIRRRLNILTKPFLFVVWFETLGIREPQHKSEKMYKKKKRAA